MLILVTIKIKAPRKYAILQALAGKVKTLCLDLSSSFFSNDMINPTVYNCLAIAIDCLQQGIGSLKVEEIQYDILTDLQLELESINHSCLSQKLPLVSNTIYRLTSLIKRLSDTVVQTQEDVWDC